MIKSILFFLFALPVLVFATNVDQVRNQFSQAVSDSEICGQLIKSLEVKKSISSVERAYLGALQTIWAKHTGNPIQKWKTFQRGKENLEKAVAASTNDVEVRLLRHSVQVNCPKFLGYNDHLANDKAFISARRSEVTHPELKKMLNAVLDK
ncbi:hypothetical protein ACFSQ3_09180 [Sphingobacterium corticis]|uniref:DUF1311 domain-containing protein n=1 Tax=Sphingobacterium corticis TaxID=1812823 RepID=A0ABW5NJK4_9SPHI